MYVQLKPRSIRTRLPWVLGQVGLVAAAIFVYFRIRGLTESSPGLARAHAHDIMDIERFLGIDVEQQFQSLVTPSETLETFANWVYIWGHWPAIIATMVWLVWQHRDVFLRLRDAMMISGALGMAVFVTFPVAPPRLAGLGLEDTVTESSRAYRVLQPPAFVNQYAAMPSLHTGWDLLVGISIVTAASSLALKLIGFAMPVLMAIAVVVTGNHYVLDVVAGVSLAMVGYVLALQLEQRRNRHPRRG
jgi:membrane-associated phospholipid phosphatase